MGAIPNAIRLALSSIARNLLRAFLTVLGILIAVAAVVTVTALGTGVREKVGSQVSSLGSNVMVVFPQQPRASGARGAQGAGERLTDDDGKAIAREAVSVSAIAPMLRAQAQVVYGDKNVSTGVFGTTAEFHKIRNWKIKDGVGWSYHDEILKTKVVVLCTTVKVKLFGDEDPVGRTVRIGRYPYTVIGVLEAKGEGPFGDQDDCVVMPIASLRARVLRTPAGFAGSFLASAASEDVTHRAVGQIDSILRQRHHIGPNDKPDFAIRTQKEFQAIQEAIYGILSMLLVLIAGISLLVGGIGIMNIMLVSVTERTREIGIRMAIGARERDIRTQFLVEAVVLAMLGGLAGAAIGTFAIAALSKALEIPMQLSPVALTVAIGAAAATGIVFGYFPARRASRLDPILALHHE